MLLDAAEIRAIEEYNGRSITSREKLWPVRTVCKRAATNQRRVSIWSGRAIILLVAEGSHDDGVTIPSI
jgi:hypothetical protein